ncbi:MAG TPA: PfkB family carbohydrate kinase, partial [Desulfatiglandales bacterium]|nr:PfkB family carbohydrate kinase [Desulfatiglandales bacterium]
MFKQDSKIAVIGDIMLDKHVHCEIIGLSPEDDGALKIRTMTEIKKPGGAANVVNNLKTLGCQNIYLYGIIGNDTEGQELTNLINDVKLNLYTCSDRPTTTKTRYISPKGRHIVRIDKEITKPIDQEIKTKIIKELEQNSVYDAIIISDYAKGIVTEELCKEIHCCSQLIIVDPKDKNLMKYGPVYAMTPNEQEWGNGTKHEAYNLIVTKGKKGCTIDIGKATIEWPVREREVGDPTGCGDSFIAGLTMALVTKYDINKACNIGMAVAACAVDHNG